MMSLLQRSRLLGVSLLVVTFLAGAFSGAALDRVLTAGEPEEVERRDDRDRGRRYIIDRVEMDPDQRTAIDAILEERSERMRAVWREVEPRLDAITDSARVDIMSVLTPEQQAQYEKKLRERRGRWDRGDHDRGDRGPAADSAATTGSGDTAVPPGKDTGGGS